MSDERELDRLCAELWLARGAIRDEAVLARIVPLVARAALELPSALPLGVLADLALILAPSLGGGPRAASALRPSPPHRDLGRALARADDDVTGRLALDPRRLEVTDSLARHALSGEVGGKDLASAVVVVLSELCAPLVGGDPPDALALRALERSGHDEIATRAERALFDPETSESLTRRLEATARAARAHGPLIDDAICMLAASAHALETRSSRLALAQLGHVTDRLEHALPRRLATRARLRGTHATDLDAESTYPAGGFAEVGTVGSFENLVPSELATFDRDVWPDAFTVRWASGELLYYLRDESVSTRRPYAITFALDADLVKARVKHPDLPVQHLVLALACVVVASRRLALALGEDDLAIRVAVPPTGFEMEETLLELAVADALGARRARVERLSEDALTRALAADVARGDALEVRVSTHTLDDRPRPRHVRTQRLVVGDHPRASCGPASSAPTLRAWGIALEAIARDAISGGADGVSQRPAVR